MSEMIESIPFQLETADAILYSCITPAFIWSLQDGALLKANNLGYEMLMIDAAQNDEQPIHMQTSIRNWNDIEEAGNHTLWLDFQLEGVGVRSVQVRNSYLSQSERILLMVVLDRKWQTENVNEQLFNSFNRIIRHASLTFCSRTDFAENIESFLDLVTVELNLEDFIFLPDEIFKQYDLFNKIRAFTQQKPIVRMLKESGVDFANYPQANLSEISLPDSESSTGWLVYPVATGDQRLGYFVFKTRRATHRLTEFYRILLDVLSVEMSELFEHMEMTKSLYQSEFENSLNTQIINNISEGVIITNSDFQIVYMNRIASLMFGFSPTDVIGHHLDNLFVSAGSVRKLIADLSTPENGTDLSSAIQYFHRRSGESFPCFIRLSSLKFDRENNYTIFVLSDVTESEESRLKTEQLAQRAFLGDFASLLAHEIRNPINNINIWIQNIKSQAREEDEIFKAAQRIEEDSMRVSQLISNILAFSRPLKLNLEETDLTQYLNDILERWKINFARADIKVYFANSEGIPKIMMDPRSMEQVFNNLIGNSVDALDGKGGMIALKLGLYESDSGRKQVQISISDNGPGIPDEMIDHIFEPFVTSKKKGNGWGLALSKRVITSHRGTIQVKSYPGGTVFDIFLPLNSGG